MLFSQGLVCGDRGYAVGNVHLPVTAAANAVVLQELKSTHPVRLDVT